MSDDRASELLELADGPIEFPADRRAELRRAMLATASQARRAPGDIGLPLAGPDERAGAQHRGWRPIVLVAASVVLVVGVVLGLLVATDRSPAPVVTLPVDRPATLVELCDVTRERATASGLLGADAATDADEVRRLAAVLEELSEHDGGSDESLASLAAQVRLLAAALDDGAGAATVNTRRAIGRDVDALFTPDGICGR